MTLSKGTFGYKQANPFTGDIDGLYLAKAALWVPYYANRQTQLGATATLVNFGDTSNWGATSAATGTGMKFSATGLSPTWTPSSAMSAWATAFDLTQPSNWQGLAPVLTFDGTNNDISTPDAAYWTQVAANDDTAYSVGMWVYFTIDGTNQILMGKAAAGGADDTEWSVLRGSGDNAISLLQRDPSVPVGVSRATDAAVAGLAWKYVIITSAGTTGATAMNGVAIYVNGAVVASTATNQATYVAMEDGTPLPYIGSRGGALRLQAKVAGGPFCPFLTQVELTAAQVANLYAFERLGMGV